MLSWAEAKNRFLAAVGEVRRLAGERQETASALARAAEPDAALVSLRQQAVDRREYASRLRAHRDELVQQSDGARDACLRAEAAVTRERTLLARAGEETGAADLRVRSASKLLHDHVGGKPGLLRRLWERNALHTWEGEGQSLASALNGADRSLAEAEARYRERAAVLSARQYDLNDAARARKEAQARLSRCEKEIRDAISAAGSADRAVRERQEAVRREVERLEQARARWAGTLPGDEWNADSDDRDAMEVREKSSPWMDEEFAVARSRAFLAALDLHRAVLTAEPDLMWNSLRAAVDVVNGDAPPGLSPDKVLAAWQVIFFVVPAISTTFASLPRMFAALGREALGWLFIDEAGQAAPQQAVGALWRSRRAVAVGDPLQLEPVVTLPWSGQKRLCRRFAVDPQWAPQNVSVQSVADRLNVYGTWLPAPGGQGYAWVGSPLRVHRRCDRLMFEVSNAIAYDGMMVNGVTRKSSFETIGKSMWLDVAARPSGPKWNPAEGRYVAATLGIITDRIRQQMGDELTGPAAELRDWAVTEESRKAEFDRRVTGSVFVISPFRDVVHELRALAADLLPPGARRQVGTVHTTQGKEADVVILVLGTAASQGGSREWAAKKPNLLNVAVTRARRRLVVIGDYHHWSGLENFEALARHDGGLLTVMDATKRRVAVPGNNRNSRSTPTAQPKA
jgi:hypothetical protein